MTRTAEIRARLAAASPGEWRVEKDPYDDWTSIVNAEPLPPEGEWDDRPPFWRIPAENHVVQTTNEYQRMRDADATLIAHAPADLAWLLEVAEAAERLERAVVSYVRVRTLGPDSALVEADVEMQQARAALREVLGR